MGFTKRTKWKTIPRYPGFSGWYVTSIRMNGKQMEPYIWDAIKSELEKGFKDQGAEKFSESQWLEHVYKGSNKVRFEYCETSQKALTYIRQEEWRQT